MTNRRWYQFSLRVMFVLVMLVSIPLAWTGYQLNWIRQRRNAIEGGLVVRDKSVVRGFVKAPGWLPIFGESGMPGIAWSPSRSGLTRENVAHLFPEAQLMDYDNPGPK